MNKLILITLVFNVAYGAQQISVGPKKARALTAEQKEILNKFRRIHFVELLSSIYDQISPREYTRDLDGIRDRCSDSNHHSFDKIIAQWLQDNLNRQVDSAGMCGCNVFSYLDDQNINWDVFPGVNVNDSNEIKEARAIEFIIKNTAFVTNQRMKSLKREFQKIMNACISSDHKKYSNIIKAYLKKHKLPNNNHCICKFLASKQTQSIQFVAGQDFENFADQDESSKCSCIVM